MGTPKAKVALITGAAQGIGRAIALRLADDGFDIGVNDLAVNRQALQELTADIGRRGVRAHAATADVSDPSEVDRMVTEVVDVLGRLDVLIANAGIVGIASPLLDLTPEEWDRVMAVNARGAFLSYRAAARRFIQQGGGGKIIGAASVAAHRSSALVGHYSASKSAIRSLTETAAVEWARHGITVNAYSPGLVHTGMWDDLDRQLADIQGVAPGSIIDGAESEIPLGRVQRPDDVAGLVSYLASPAADYMTGRSLVMDGGLLLG
ncbi:SDR family oxidoreductase [Nocardia cyriacigeorgica]|uniref:SDR family oxidoreductase n=1 Tax=Nocardia cyriacigeorgica TaxID=135487 RepID=A0A6P1D369_9NOCA|nr:SDR family oxidoreductase [Nocardia cyriacigeorgica]NEW45045.1 SDR family oxidoreductase [Nocardia cyriacigeorgica]